MKIRNLTLTLAFILSTCILGFSQSFIFGPKLGPGFGVQFWNGFDRQPLLATHVAAFIESYDEDNPNSSLYAQVGYHVRGSSERVLFTGGGTGFRNRQKFKFNNLSLLAGAKKILNPEKTIKPFYTLGLRLEYTLSTNLEQYEVWGGYFPVDPFVNKLNYGFTVSGGFQKQISDHIGAQLEFVISPDISKQYNQFQIENVINPFNPGNARTLPEQNIRNLTFEISIGFRFLRKVEYY